MGYNRANYDIFCGGDVILGVRINDEIPDVTRTSSFQHRVELGVPPNF